MIPSEHTELINSSKKKTSIMETGSIEITQIGNSHKISVDILEGEKIIGQATLELNHYDKKKLEGFEDVVKLIIKK